jgi:hypothetical protein
VVVGAVTSRKQPLRLPLPSASNRLLHASQEKR